MDSVDYRLPSDASIEEIKKSLNANGICVLPEFLSKDKTQVLKDAVKDLAYTEHKHHLALGKSRLGRFSMDEVCERGHNGVADLIGDDFYQSLANDFFKPYHPDFHKIYCHHDVETMDFNNAWHFDRGLTLKFFFYLNDVKKENGAFCYDLGSHRHNAVKQHLWWEAKTPMLNFVPENEIRSPKDIEGGAGTLIIFDVSGYHQAGTITSGDRWVLRYHVKSGKRADNQPQHLNPYARRNWEYRSGCYTERENEKDQPWGELFKKTAEASELKKPVKAKVDEKPKVVVDKKPKVVKAVNVTQKPKDAARGPKKRTARQLLGAVKRRLLNG